MFASISVVTYNRRRLSEYCIDSIFKTTKKSACELIVVDNGSSDGTISMLQRKLKGKVIDKVIFNKTTSLGQAINVAWSAASKKANWLITFSNDHFVMSGWFENFRKVIKGKNPDYVFCLLRMATFHRKELKKISNGGIYMEGANLREKRRVEVGGGLAIKKKLIRKHGLRFSEAIFTPKTKSPYSIFCFQLLALNLKRLDLGKPCALEQDSEFANPEYEEYYFKTFGHRAKLERWKKLKRDGSYNPAREEEYYRGSKFRKGIVNG